VAQYHKEGGLSSHSGLRERASPSAERGHIQTRPHQAQGLERPDELDGEIFHDFNNLLVVIINYAAFVADDLAVEARAPGGSRWQSTLEDVEHIRRASERAASLTRQMPAFARDDATRSEANRYQRGSDRGGAIAQAHEYRPPTYADGRLSIDFVQHVVLYDERAVTLTPLEFKLLATFVRHPNQVLSRGQLLELVWDDVYGVSPGQVKLYVGYLRRKLDPRSPDSTPIETVRGFGYRYRRPGQAGGRV
jgi:signal transduction histidine kinase